MDKATEDTLTKNSIDSATFMNDRNLEGSRRARSARKSGMLPTLLDPLDSSRSTQTKTGGVQKTLAKEDAPSVPPQPQMRPQSHKSEAPVHERSCMSIASELQDVAENARQCFNSNEIRRLVSLRERNALPICLAIVMSAISFILGVYVTKKGLIAMPR